MVISGYIKKLELQLDIFKIHNDISVVTGDIEYVDSDGVTTNNLKREVFNKVGYFNTDFIIAEDWEYWRRFSYYYKFYSMNKVLANVRLHSDNISKTRSEDPFDNFILYRKLTQSLLEWGKGRFEITDCNLIYRKEWLHYRKIMSNHYPGVLNKIKFLNQVFVHDFRDGVHLLFLLLKC